MIITGFLGTWFGLGIAYFEIPMDAPPDSSMLLSVAGASAAGIIQSTGVMLVFKSFQYGSLEVMYLFMNMRVLVQIVEEFILFQILPSFISSVGMIVALSGASIMIIFDQRDHRKCEKQDKSY